MNISGIFTVILSLLYMVKFFRDRMVKSRAAATYSRSVSQFMFDGVYVRVELIKEEGNTKLKLLGKGLCKTWRYACMLA